MTTRILITGSSGFLGGHLASAAQSAGHVVIPYDLPAHSILDAMQFEHDLHESDLVIHCAAQADVYESIRDERRNFETNVHGTDLISSIAASKKIPFWFISTLCVYGNNQPATEFTTPEPTEVYAASKMAGEYCVRSHSDNWAIWRVPTMYGPGMRPALFIYQALKRCMTGETIHVNGSGDASRQYGYAPDVARAIIGAVGKDCGGQIVNLPGPESVSVNGVIACAENITGRKAVKEMRASRSWEIFSQHIRSVTGPGIGIDCLPTLFTDGMKKTFEWMNG